MRTLFFGLAVIMLFSACAAKQEKWVDNRFEAATGVVVPLAPISPMDQVVIQAKADAPVDKVAPSGMQKRLNELRNNAMTLYWKEKQVYALYVGGEINAEYRQGKGLILREAEETGAAAECHFSEKGVLTGNVPDEQRENCQKLMFSLDKALEN